MRKGLAAGICMQRYPVFRYLPDILTCLNDATSANRYVRPQVTMERIVLYVLLLIFQERGKRDRNSERKRLMRLSDLSRIHTLESTKEKPPHRQTLLERCSS
jgi:hypothetical protein